METLIQAFQALHPRRWWTGLWLNPDFRKLWGSLTIVHFGGQITFLALPLTAALVLNASPFEVGVLTALEALPYPVCGLFAGVLVDRASAIGITDLKSRAVAAWTAEDPLPMGGIAVPGAVQTAVLLLIAQLDEHRGDDRPSRQKNRRRKSAGKQRSKRHG